MKSMIFFCLPARCRTIVSALVLGIAVPTLVFGGETRFEFTNGDATSLQIFGDAKARASGGVNDSGYLSITDAVNDQRSIIIFPAFDDGAVVKAFTFSMDVRMGNPAGQSGRSADGFSISYARSDDPVLVNPIGVEHFALSQSGVGS